MKQETNEELSNMLLEQADYDYAIFLLNHVSYNFKAHGLDVIEDCFHDLDLVLYYLKERSRCIMFL